MAWKTGEQAIDEASKRSGGLIRRKALPEVAYHPIDRCHRLFTVDEIIHHLGVTFRSQRPPPPAQHEELY